MQGKILFREIQRFSANPVWLTSLAMPTLFFAMAAIYQIATGKPVGNHPMPILVLITLSVVFLIILLWTTLGVSFTTVVTTDLISFGWNIPDRSLNRIPMSDVKEINVVRYSFVGYGYRITRRYGTVYNVFGNKGLQIVTAKGEKILIGTSKPEQLREAIKDLRKNAG